MRILGLDYGSRTVGVAVSDPLMLTAQAVETITRKEENKLRRTLARLEVLAKEYEVSGIVIGLPKNMNNTIGPRAIETLEFKQKLENLNYNVVLQDERLSTVSAHNYMIKADLSRKKRKEKVDALAATIILQTYLDKENNNERRTNEI